VRVSEELRRAADPIVAAQHDHPFVRGIGDGTLAAQSFRHYVRQDYLFLLEYARLLALASARAPSLELMTRFAALARAILETELELHRAYASEWGISAEELERERMTPTTRAYTAFLLRTATLGDFAELVGALLPCMAGYREIGRRLAERGRPDDERYARWIDMYAGEEFGELADWCCDVADGVGADLTGEARGRMRGAYLESARYELAFWDMGWRREQPL
jgi:thiaminase/transcriptional activator TenA